MSKEKIIRRYSSAFKRTVVEEVERGASSIEQIRQRYDIGGSTTIHKWLRQYGKQHLLHTVVHIQMQDEPQRIAKLKQRIKELEQALVQSQIEKIQAQAYLQVITEEQPEIKKNIEALPSPARETLLGLLGSKGSSRG